MGFEDNNKVMKKVKHNIYNNFFFAYLPSTLPPKEKLE